MKAGVVAVQGAAPEHVAALERAMGALGVQGEVITIRSPTMLAKADCIIIPGGESTTISKLLRRFDLLDPLVNMGTEGVPIMGTCAGCVLLAKEGDDEVAKTGTKLLELMDMSVDRNAFGRQRESFEAPLDIKGVDGPFPGVFIRGPVIRQVWGRAEVLSTYKDKIVMARQDNMLALSFHPELSGDTRIHELLLKMAL